MNQVNAFLDSKALIFKVNKEEYGVYINQVISIERMQAITPYPNRPEHVLGVTSIRDMVIPVIDLCSALTGTQVSTTDAMRLIIVKAQEKEIGIVVDAATDVLEIDRSTMQGTKLIENKDAGYLIGISEIEERLIILLDIENLLNDITNLDELRVMVESFRKQNEQSNSEGELT